MFGSQRNYPSQGTVSGPGSRPGTDGCGRLWSHTDGPDWLKVFLLDWSLHRVSSDSGELQKILDKHGAMFKDELGLVKGTLARIHIDSSTKLCFH